MAAAWADGAWAVGAWADGAWVGGTGGGGTIVTPPVVSEVRLDSCSVVPIIHTDDAILVASSEVASMLVSNLQTPNRDEVWRSLNTSTTTITFSFPDGKARGVGFWGLYGHRLFGATVQMELFYYSDLSGIAVYDSGAIPAGTLAMVGQKWGMVEGSVQDYDITHFDQPVWRFFAPMLYVKSGRLTITGNPYDENGDPLSYYQIQRLVVGPYYQFGRGVDWAPALSVPTNTRRTRSGGGSNRRNRGATWEKLECNMRTTTPEDYRALASLMKWMGDGRDGVLALHTGRTGWRGRVYTLNGCFTSEDAFTLDYNNLGGRKLVFESN